MRVDFPELAAIRLGYGLSPVLPPPADARTVLADVAATAARPATYTLDAAAGAMRHASDLEGAEREAVKAGGDGQAQKQAVKDYRRSLNLANEAVLGDRLAQAATAPVGFGERLVQFWANHFTVIARRPNFHPLTAAFVDQAIRPNIGGTFLQLFTAAETHPAMLIYLDQHRSVGENSARGRRRSGKPVGVNENLAREMLELHSLGVGAAYSQDDVRQLAYLLTGLTFDARKPDTVFEPNFVQPGAETVLGKSYGGGRRDGMEPILAAFRDIVARPEAARFIARKLAMHFISDAPDEGLVSDLAAAWGREGDLPAIYAVLVGHPQLAAQFRAKVRQPFDFLAAALRALAIDPRPAGDTLEPAGRRWLSRALAQMGQPFMHPGGPDGWSDAGTAWITPQFLAERIDWAMNAPKALLDALPDPRAFLGTTLGATASEALAMAVPRAESARDGVGIILASTDFNRR